MKRSIATFIARKYFFSKSHVGAVNLMNLTALVGLALGTAAMIVVLAAFQGLESLIGDQFQNVNATLKVEPVNGKHLVLDDTDSNLIANLIPQDPEAATHLVVEQRVLAHYGEQQHIVWLKGVTQHYRQTHNVEENLVTQYPIDAWRGPLLSIGGGVGYHLGISHTNPPQTVNLYLPEVSQETNVLNIGDNLRHERALAVEIFELQADFDANNILAPYDFVAEFIGNATPSYLEIQTTQPKLWRNALEGPWKDKYTIRNRIEQEATLFKVMQSEHTVVILLLSFVIFLSTFGVASAQIMIALEKKQDTKTLWSMGATTHQLRSIFALNGLLTVLVSWITGIGLGLLLVYIQQEVGLLRLGSGYIENFYPVEWQWNHVWLVSGVVLGIGTVMSVWSARNVVKRL